MIKKKQIKNKAIKLEILNSRYFFLAKKIMHMSGLGPDQSFLNRSVRVAFVLILSGMALIPQIIASHKYYFLQYNYAKFLKAGSSVIFFSGSLVRFLIPLTTFERLKVLLKKIDDNWKLITDKYEIEELKRCSQFGRFLMLIYIAYMTVGTMLYVTLPAFIPTVLDFIVPLNNSFSRKKHWILYGEYLIDKDNNYYKIYFLEATSAWASIFMILSIDTIFIGGIHHCVGLISIFNLRVRQTTKLGCPVRTCVEVDSVYNQMVHAVKLHEIIIQFCKSMEYVYSWIFFFMEIFILLWISFGANCLLAYKNEPLEFFRYILILIGMFMNLFYGAFQGQILIDSSEKIFTEIYGIEWNECSINVKKLVLIVMMRAKDPLMVTAGGLHPVDYKHFLLLIRTIISYITIIASLALKEGY